MPTERPVPTFDHLKSKKKAIVTKAVLYADSEVVEEFNQVKMDLANLEVQSRLRPDDADLKAQMTELKAKRDELEPGVKDLELVFKFRSIGRSKFDKMVSTYPPTEDQIKEWVDAGGNETDVTYDTEQFPLALIAAASLEPKITLAEITALWDDDDWNSTELTTLFQAAYSAQLLRSQADLGKG